MTTVYLALGSNLGDRAAFIAEAVARLEAGGVDILARSPLYETDAVADEPQPPYLNAVVRATTALSAGDLLARGLEIERQLGRTRPPGQTKSARTIDIDLLLYGDLVINVDTTTADATDAARSAARPALAVPHPALLARPFVRIPLADVAAAGLRHPITGEALDRARASAGVRRLGGVSPP